MFMNNFIFSTVIIEVTRRCNMSCPHCLRGDAQNVDMDLYILDKFLSNFKNGYIREILFTGGEPSLNPEAIQFTLETVRKYNITVQSFLMITNGKHISDELVSIVNSTGNFNVAVSQDIYHDALTEDDYRQLRKISGVYSKSIDARDTNLLNIGRAKKNNIGSREFSMHLVFSEYYGYNVVVYPIVCTCLGDVLESCNYSFDSDYKSKICEYDDDLYLVLRDLYSERKFASLESICFMGKKMYMFFEYLKKKGIEI